MPRKPKPIPTGHHTITPFLVVEGAKEFHKFVKKAFGAEVLGSMQSPDKKSIVHSALRIGNSIFFAADAGPMAAATPGNLFLYVEDADAVFKKAVKAGATVVMPLADMFWGDRWGYLKDPFGNNWQVATHIEDVDPKEMTRRMKAMPPPPPAEG
jgi:PhnB protein